jgi:hypothetical protein
VVLRLPIPASIVRPLMWRAAPLVALLLVAGCGHNIGDPCQTNVDCNPQGDRFCDTASLNGYCTQENCDFTSCPGDSVCVRFFSPLADEVCDPAVPDDPTMPLAPPLCSIDERCVCDESLNGKCATQATLLTADGGTPVLTDGGVMEVTGGHCAPTASEHRWCMKRCAHNGDCRGGYQCRETGTAGAEGLPTFDMGEVNSKFCAPTGITN